MNNCSKAFYVSLNKDGSNSVEIPCANEKHHHADHLIIVSEKDFKE